MARPALALASATLAGAAQAAGPPPTPPPFHVVSQMPAGDGGWDLLSISQIDERLYVAHGDRVTAFDLSSGKVTDRLVPGQRVHAALAIPGTHDVISTNGDSNNAYLFDGRTGRIRAIVPTGSRPDAAAFDPATRTVWVMNPGSGDITVVDPATARVVATVPVGGSLEMGEADGRGHLYVNVEDRNQLAVLDTRSLKVSARLPLDGCDGPTGIALNERGNEIVSACANGVAIVSAPDGHQIARLPIGKGADGAGYDPLGHVVLVPAGRDGTITMIRLGREPAVLGRVPTAASARTIAVDHSTGRAYLPSAKLAPAAAGERPKPLPGTFRVLVVAP